MGMIHNKEVHGVILKKKKKRKTAGFRQISATGCVAELPQLWSSLQHSPHRGFGEFPSRVLWGRRTSTKVMQDATVTGSRSPATLLPGSLYRELPCKPRFSHFYQGKKKSWLHPCAQATGVCNLMHYSDWLREIATVSWEGGLVAQTVWGLWFIDHVLWERWRSIFLLYSAWGCSPSAQPFWWDPKLATTDFSNTFH